MNRKQSHLSRVQFAGKASEQRPKWREGERVTAGVPLSRLIKRRLSPRAELVMLSKANSLASERFRRLKTLLLHDSEAAPQVIVVTSPAPSEGKSLVSTNLALAFAADRDGEVLLIDADMRRPTLEQWLDPAPQLGLSELLRDQTEIEHAVLQLEDSALQVLPAGTPARDPVELLSRDLLEHTLSHLRHRFRRIVIDTPPIVPFTDADILGRLSDGVLVVARAGQTRRTALSQALDSVTSTRVLGIALNDASFNLADWDQYRSTTHYYDYYSQRGEQ